MVSFPSPGMRSWSSRSSIYISVSLKSFRNILDILNNWLMSYISSYSTSHISWYKWCKDHVWHSFTPMNTCFVDFYMFMAGLGSNTLFPQNKITYSTDTPCSNTNTLLFLYKSNTLPEKNQIQTHVQIWPQSWFAAVCECDTSDCQTDGSIGINDEHQWAICIASTEIFVMINEIHKNLWRCPGLVKFIYYVHSRFISY